MTKATPCPECGAAASGNFCASCGTPLGSRFCTQCGAKAQGGARFCTQCGASMAGGPSGKVRTPAAKSGVSGPGANPNTGWWIAGAMMVVVILFMAWPILNPSAPPAGAPVGAAPGGATGPADIANMSPREAADRLFNRVMAAAEANDSSQVTTFLPMAIQAYDIARPLDPDGLYHLSRLQRIGTLDADALATAQELLAVQPDHLLGLYAAGDAALSSGNEAAAREYFGRLLSVWDQEISSGNQDYELHAQQMEQIRGEAEALVNGG